MKANTKKYVIAGGIALVSVFGAIAYLQYKKLMGYCLSFKSVKVNKISLSKMNFNLWLNFFNKSRLPFTIISQTYMVYINNLFVTKAVNYSNNKILPKTTSTVSVNVDVNPIQALNNLKSLGSSLFDINNLQVRVDMKIRIKILGVKFNIPYSYVSTVNEMRQPNSTNSSSNSGKC